jgi:hypothetical protein
MRTLGGGGALTCSLYYIKNWLMKMAILALYQFLFVLAFIRYSQDKFEFDYDTIMNLSIYYLCSIIFTCGLLVLYERLAERSKNNMERSLSFQQHICSILDGLNVAVIELDPSTDSVSYSNDLGFK